MDGHPSWYVYRSSGDDGGGGSSSSDDTCHVAQADNMNIYIKDRITLQTDEASRRAMKIYSTPEPSGLTKLGGFLMGLGDDRWDVPRGALFAGVWGRSLYHTSFDRLCQPPPRSAFFVIQRDVDTEVAGGQNLSRLWEAGEAGYRIESYDPILFQARRLPCVLLARLLLSSPLCS